MDEPKETSGPGGESGPEGGRGSAGPFEGATDTLRRFLATGVGTLFATEEGLRKLATELPKEVATFLIGQAQHTKDEMLRIVANELRRFLENLDLTDSLRRVLSSVTREVKVRFLPNEEAPKGEGKRHFSMHRRSGGEKEPGVGPGSGNP